MQGNDRFLPFTCMPGDSSVYFGGPPPGTTVIFFSTEARLPRADEEVLQRQFRIAPTLPLGGGAALIPLGLATWDGGSGGVEGMNCSWSRLIVAGLLQKSGTVPLAELIEAVEFYHAGFDHYFLSANPDEILLLDTGYFKGGRGPARSCMSSRREATTTLRCDRSAVITACHRQGWIHIFIRRTRPSASA